MVKGEIAHYAQFLLFLQCFHNICRSTATCKNQILYGKSFKKQRFFNVPLFSIDAPVAESMSEDTVLPELDQDARIYCSFRGFPDNVDWFKEGSILTNVSKYLFETLQTDLEKGTTTAVLRVRSVTNADYGTYACTGENMYGNDTITGKLQSKFVSYICFNFD